MEFLILVLYVDHVCMINHTSTLSDAEVVSGVCHTNIASGLCLHGSSY